VLCGFKKTVPYHTLNRPTDPVREVFDIAGFSSLFSTYGSQDEAIKDLQTETRYAPKGEDITQGA
jgi:hypothetical protein